MKLLKFTKQKRHHSYRSTCKILSQGEEIGTLATYYGYQGRSLKVSGYGVFLDYKYSIEALGVYFDIAGDFEIRDRIVASDHIHQDGYMTVKEARHAVDVWIIRQILDSF